MTPSLPACRNLAALLSNVRILPHICFTMLYEHFLERMLNKRDHVLTRTICVSIFHILKQSQLRNWSRLKRKLTRLSCNPNSVQWEMLPLEKARETGALALFGEKYPDIVRVVSIGDFSRELCGGTHLSSTAEIGLFRIVNEESVAAGTRRITARTGLSAMDLVREQQKRQDTLCSLLKTAPPELPQRVETLVQELRDLKKQLKSKTASSADMSVEQLLNDATEVSGTQIIVREVSGWDTSTMRNQIDKLRKTGSPVAILFASKSDSQVQMVAGLSRELIEQGIHAGNWIRTTAQIVGGGGGGKPDMAQAGGTLPEKLNDALRSALTGNDRITRVAIVNQAASD